MIWAILAFLGVPLWLCALGILALVLRNRSLRQREGNIPIRVQRVPGKNRWTRGHGVWVSDVFAWRGCPAAWREDLLHVIGAQVGTLASAAAKKLRRLGDSPAVVTLTPEGREPIRVAVASESMTTLLGPFVPSPPAG
ncbi:MAG: hypothetical protein MUF33_06575 [Candidatus Nanopelagicales bacterium]|jgi:hypothetical protein|nr:hypothetical protein [Candidatus Nanopelagicales bacterium]MCU0298169.1 hypothetical protein [Candidatus Nanopelagicales bacterium]